MSTSQDTTPAEPSVAEQHSTPDLASIGQCDLIMKGGVTSGIVYPKAVAAFARCFRLRSIGGASAGAIAAGAAAAMQLGRMTRRIPDPIEQIEEIPEYLGKKVDSGETRLFELFQPEQETRRLFRLFVAGLSPTKRSRLRAIVLWTLALFWQYLWHAIIGLVAGGALFLAGSLLGKVSGSQWDFYLWLLLIATASFAACVIGVVCDLRRAVPGNLLGLCTGFGKGTTTSLTPWLNATIQSLAGRDADKLPVTFGDLWDAGEAEQTQRPHPAQVATRMRQIDLRVMTTALTQGQPYSFPLEPGVRLMFKEGEFRRLFPPYIVDWLKDKARGRDSTEAELGEYTPLPDMADLPILVAIRMSLSFPVLLSAVPLYGPRRLPKGAEDKAPVEPVNDVIDADAVSAGEGEITGDAGDQTSNGHIDAPAAESTSTEACAPAGSRSQRKGRGRAYAKRIWFSDGGICSNFPVHFFDAPMPTRPTFAINLVELADNDPRLSPGDPEQLVEVPRDNVSGLNRPADQIDEDGEPRVFNFIRSILNTMQNWNDNTQLRVPGYRDRVARVYLKPGQGGLNLRMDGTNIGEIAERGRLAAEGLCERFQPTGAGGGQKGPCDGWHNHRWIRFRTASVLLEQALEGLLLADDHTRGRSDDIRALHHSACSYSLAQVRARRSLHGYDQLLALARWMRADRQQNNDEPVFSTQDRELPKPASYLRIRPRL